MKDSRYKYLPWDCKVFGCIETWDWQGAWCARTRGCHRPIAHGPIWKRWWKALMEKLHG